MPPRRQRKRKAQTVLSGTQFIEEVGDSFDKGAFEEGATFKDMFDDLKGMNNLNQNLESYFMEFYERIICGCSGVLVGEPAEPMNYSMLACSEEELESFSQAFEEFLQRFPIMRNVMDKVLFRFLCRLKALSAATQKRLLKVIGLFIKNKTYNRSKKEEFFLTAVAREPDGTEAVCLALDAIKAETSDQFAFTFSQQFGFLTVLKMDDFDLEFFKEKMAWFVAFIDKMNREIEREEYTRNLVESFKQSKNIDASVQEARNLCSTTESWVEFLLVAVLKSLDVINKGIQVSLTQFAQVVPLLKEIGVSQSVPLQGLVMDVLMKECYANPSLSEAFKALVIALFQEEIVDGNVILAWDERAQGNGKATFGKQLFRFVEWLKQE